MSADVFIGICVCVFLILLHVGAVWVAMRLINALWSRAERWCLTNLGPWGCSESTPCRGCRR